MEENLSPIAFGLLPRHFSRVAGVTRVRRVFDGKNTSFAG